MKRTIPLLITSIGGFILVASAFIPAAQGAGETVTMWFNILAAIAMVLGGANLAQVQLKVISDRKPGWGYAAIVLLSFFITLGFGLAKLGVRPDTSSQFPGEIWQPIPLSAFPTSTLDLTQREQDVLAPVIDRLRRQPPASVASQIRFNADSLSFQGWMNADQRRELIDAAEDVLWKSAAERLSKAAAVPESVSEIVLHRGDRNMLAALQPISEEDRAKLDSLLSNAPTGRLAIASKRETTVTAVSVRSPSGANGELISLKEPEESAELAPGVLLVDGRITIQGSLSPAQQAALQERLVASRPRNGLSVEAAQASAQDWGLEREATDRFVTAITQPIDIDALLLAVESASAPTNTPRSWTDIAADVEAGNPSPPLTTSSEAEPALSDEQIASLRSIATDHLDANAATPIIATLAPRQQAAAEAILAGLPSNAVRQRDIAFELLAENLIDRATADKMLSDYRTERGIGRAIDALYHNSQQQKFDYAADYAKNGSAFWWIYEYLFKPLTATMFSMLAFYISSAAFRAFRAKNVEAALLLGTAFIVLLGRTFAGVWLTSGLPEWLSFLKIEELTVFIMSIFNTAGNRAIMIGIALGIISTSLKVLLGMDRSYLGKD